MYKPPKNRLNYCNRMSSYGTAATCIFYHSNREHTSDRNKPQLAVFSFLNICGVTWWYIKYIQFVRGHAYSTGGRVNGKGGVNWVWTPPRKNWNFKINIDYFPNLKQNFTLGKCFGVSLQYETSSTFWDNCSMSLIIRGDWALSTECW